MPDTYAKIRKSALSLAQQRRADLAMELLASLEQLTPEEAERLWAQEGERRLKALREGKLESVSGPKAIARIRSRLGR